MTYAYDARGRMISAVTAGVTTSYTFNGFGERLRKTGSNVPSPIESKSGSGTKGKGLELPIKAAR